MLLVAFAITLFIAVLISCKTRQSVLSVSVLFLASGLLVGKGILHIPVPNRDLLYRLSELALFSVLFTDGMHTGGVANIRKYWHLPGRVLLIGMPLTIVGIGLLAHELIGLSWSLALLVGAVLSPTDPVFVSAIFQFEAVPERIKRVLNIESGLNDGLALPAVLILLNSVSTHSSSLLSVMWEMVLGVAIGIGIPWIGIKLEASRIFGAAGLFERLNAFALGLLVLAVAEVLGANLFLAAFASGITLVSVSPAATDAFRDFGETVTELLKLAALLIFGARIAPILFSLLPWTDYLFAFLALFLVRPFAVQASMARTGIPQRETLTIGWFGPKGFSSVVYTLMILHASSTGTAHAARVCGLVIAISIVIYSSTDILVGRWYQKEAEKNAEASDQHAFNDHPHAA